MCFFVLVIVEVDCLEYVDDCVKGEWGVVEEVSEEVREIKKIGVFVLGGYLGVSID